MLQKLNLSKSLKEWILYHSSGEKIPLLILEWNYENYPSLPLEMQIFGRNRKLKETE